MIVVTGADGQLGREVVPALRRIGRDVRGFSRGELDVADRASLDRLLEECRPELVVNCAAWTAVEAAEDDPAGAWLANAHGPWLLGMLGLPVVHVSTDYVFDGRAGRAYAEEDACRPLSVYGASKRAGETALLASGAPGLILRTSWLWSERPGTRNFFHTIRRLAAQRSVLEVVDDQIGAPTRAADLAAAVASLVEQGAHHGAMRVLHAASRGEASWCDFARAIVAGSGLSAEVRAIPTSAYPCKARRPARSVLDTTRLRRTFGLELPHWRESLQTALHRHSSTS